jgi:FkbM family methyltransferase
MKQLIYQLKKFRRDARILAHFGTLNPERILLPGSDCELYVDPHDQRARKMIIYKSLRRNVPRNQLFWQKACTELAPGIALDVGANYGECLFGTEYNPKTRVIGVEANSALVPFLERSRSIHCDADQIELHNVLAAAESATDVPFWVLKGWSGGSTAVASLACEDQNKFEQQNVAARSIDDIVGLLEKDRSSPVVFKIDVEGFEPDVISGMSRVIGSNRPLIGIIEFDENYLKSAGTDVDEFWNLMQTSFEVYWFTDDRNVTCLSGRPYSAVRSLVVRKRIHSDVMLVSKHSADVFSDFVKQWEQSGSTSAELNYDARTRAA